MHRLNAYSSPNQHGGVTVDCEGMALDLITVLKAGGVPKDEFLTHITKMWDETEVTISIPQQATN